MVLAYCVDAGLAPKPGERVVQADSRFHPIKLRGGGKTLEGEVLWKGLELLAELLPVESGDFLNSEASLNSR